MPDGDFGKATLVVWFHRFLLISFCFPIVPFVLPFVHHISFIFLDDICDSPFTCNCISHRTLTMLLFLFVLLFPFCLVFVIMVNDE